MSDPIPVRGDFRTLAEYLQAFHLWRAQRRDGYLTNAEVEAKYDVIVGLVHEEAKRKREERT